MKKKVMFLIMMLLTSCVLTSSAGEVQDNRKVKMTPRNGIHNGTQRSPIEIPEVYIDGYTLTFEASCIGCPITLVDEEDNIVYTTYVDETGTVELPTTLTGAFELQLIRGSITFVGEIELA